MKRLATCIAGHIAIPVVFITLAASAFGQRLDPVQWTLTSDTQSAPAGSAVSLHLKATLQPEFFSAGMAGRLPVFKDFDRFGTFHPSPDALS